MTALPKLDAELEAALVSRARRGGSDRGAVTSELFRLYRSPLLELCSHLTGRRADAEDVVQETFAAVHRALPMFRGDSRLSTWIYRIAVRLALDAKGRQRPVGEITDDEVVDTRAEHLPAARHEVRRVARAMERLPAAHRAVLSLFAIEGLRHREIADILGVAEGTVWARLCVARRALIELLQPPGPL